MIVLTIRAKSVYVVGDLFGTSGGETLAAYAIWKVQHVLKLYEWPFRAPFALTIYNYLFYFTYATAASVLHWDGGSLLRFGRYLTLLFALIGAAAQWQLTLLLVPKQTRRIRLLLPMLAFVTWLGSSLVSWWVLTIRADIAASALVMLALLTFFYGSIKRIAWTPVLTACVFFLAWSLKQTFVYSLAGLLLFLLYTRRYKSVLQISATLGVLCTICLIVGGPEYRYNILVAPPLVHTYSLANAVRYLLQSVVPNLFIFGFPVYYLLSRPASKPLNPTPKNVSATNWTLPFWFMFWTSLTLSFLTSTKEGATTNYYLEWYFAASVLAGLLCAEVISDGSQQTRHQIAAAVLLLTSLIYPAIQVLAFTLKINTP